MALFGMSKKEKEEKEALLSQIASLQLQLSPEQRQVNNLKGEIETLMQQKAQLDASCSQAAAQLRSLYESVSTLKKQVVILEDEILYQDFGLYRPLYDFATSDQYKQKLEQVRQQQKDLISNKHACDFSNDFSLNGSKSQGRKMVNDNVKQILRSFNTECENAIDRVKFNNIDSMRARIQKSYDALNKLNSAMMISITRQFLNLKFAELDLAVEYALKKQEEKEAARQAREELREQQKLETEIRAAREKIDKERKHYTKAINDLEKRISLASPDELPALQAKRELLSAEIQALDDEEKQIDYREQNAKAGYVYIISNIGAFGENVFKIGMTRRLEPMDRIDELGDASVPFRFDVHALIFSNDAPKLEGALHREFDSRKINMVNGRKEFFRVTLDEIKTAVNRNYDKTVDFISLPSAEEYRQSEAMRKQQI